MIPGDTDSPDCCSSADRELIAAAAAAREHAYAPYSKFAVGAAVRTGSGAVFHGCNVENAAYGHAICAERVALFSAVAAGATEIGAIAVVAALPGPVTPCGACRQVMSELAPEARVIMANVRGDARVSSVAALLPCAFTAVDEGVERSP